MELTLFLFKDSPLINHLLQHKFNIISILYAHARLEPKQHFGHTLWTINPKHNDIKN